MAKGKEVTGLNVNVEKDLVNILVEEMDGDFVSFGSKEMDVDRTLGRK